MCGSARCYCGTALSAEPSVHGGVPVVPALAEGAALDALLERRSKAHRTPVLTAQPLADLLAVQLALLLQEVVDERDLALEPVLVLVGILRRGAGERGVSAHCSPPEAWMLSPRAKRPWPRSSVYGSASSPGSSSSSCVAESGGAMSSRSRPAASTPISAWMTPPTIITTAPTR